MFSDRRCVCAPVFIVVLVVDEQKQAAQSLPVHILQYSFHSLDTVADTAAQSGMLG